MIDETFEKLSRNFDNTTTRLNHPQLSPRKYSHYHTQSRFLTPCPSLEFHRSVDPWTWGNHRPTVPVSSGWGDWKQLRYSRKDSEGAWILDACRSSRMDLNKYLDILQRNCSRLLRASLAPDIHYRSPAYMNLEISFGALTTEARVFMNLCSFLHREGITEELFRQAVTSPPASDNRSDTLC